MSQRSEALFEKLQAPGALKALIGESEDADFDCKEWPRPDGRKGTIAKAACGFANATGGVIIIGLKARRGGDGQPDVVSDLCPVPDANGVKSEALDIILRCVEPGITGVAAQVVPEAPGMASGFVLIHIPEWEGTPQRSRVDRKEFYVRVASGTLPMEYFQIADRFGVRPRPHLTVDLNLDAPVSNHPYITDRMCRFIRLMLTNHGRGIARFPAVRVHALPHLSICQASHIGPLPIWPVSDANAEWFTVRGGANDVVYPGETLKIASLVQLGDRRIPNDKVWGVPATQVITEVVCDGMFAHRQTFQITEAY
ncbi:AlbA family DNA-binding domain-containing protein [Occallatibacter riparius]|uniref:ATP-binding protein n=1 Tax=Occallatibacter riparius TaxID=1002689 RepID=A0A9J7BLF4_9BACT|nr:ATP-binding protein [Occallatibacter riparius]UWZ83479.1 ATP-binding protein [Occallatibacter riparius]